MARAAPFGGAEGLGEVGADKNVRPDPCSGAPPQRPEELRDFVIEHLQNYPLNHRNSANGHLLE